ncbi:hypothetical protein VNO77_39198 [Canavalia gladiata]|uniref:Uncharacterized protein n=1 Tax=Canavalia gladiata TaxID=3824 RepID=A0AAN9KCQ6_CANGL
MLLFPLIASLVMVNGRVQPTANMTREKKGRRRSRTTRKDRRLVILEEGQEISANNQGMDSFAWLHESTRSRNWELGSCSAFRFNEKQNKAKHRTKSCITVHSQTLARYLCSNPGSTPFIEWLSRVLHVTVPTYRPNENASNFVTSVAYDSAYVQAI